MIDSQERPLTGGCQCGSVRYEITAEPIALYACHCSECRKQSGSSFGMSLIVPRAAFKITVGEPKCWSRSSAQGSDVRCWFCPDCGTRVWHVSSGSPTFRSVKGGTLDEQVSLDGAVHLFTDRKLDGVGIPEGALCFPGEPPD